jgi:hypothetical protein
MGSLVASPMASLPRDWGTTEAERSLPLPCDGLLTSSCVTYATLPNGPGRSRLIMRPLVRHPGRGVAARVHATLLGWGDLVMARKQLLTLRKLAQQTSAASLPSDSSAAC